jgi:hypothetical protein
MVCTKCRFLHIVRMNAYLMVTRPEIKLRKESGAMEFIKQFLRHGYWEAVFHSAAVEGPVIDAESLGAVRLPDEQYRR